MAFPRATILSDNKAQVMTVAHETGKIALEIMTLYKLRIIVWINTLTTRKQFKN